MIELIQSIPAKWRQLLYATTLLGSFILGGIEVGLQAGGVVKDPTWLVVCEKVWAYVSAPVTGLVAGLNVTRKSKPEPAPAWPDDEREEPEEPGQHKRGRPLDAPKVVDPDPFHDRLRRNLPPERDRG